MTRLSVKRSASAIAVSSSSSPYRKQSKKSKTSHLSDSDNDYEDEHSNISTSFVRQPTNAPDIMISVQKAQIRAGRKVELKLDDLLRTKFRSVEVSLNFVPEINENERHYIPQPCPKVWKKKGLRTAMNGTAESHLAILKEIKKGNTITQVNACVLGKLTDSATGERIFFTNYMLIIRLEAVEGPNVILPFEVTVVTSHNGGNNTSRIDVPRCLGLPFKEVEASEARTQEVVTSAFPTSSFYAEIILPELSSPFSEDGEHYYDYDVKDEITPEPESPNTHTVTLLVEDDLAAFSSPHSFLLEEEEETEGSRGQQFEADTQDLDAISVDDLLGDWVHIPREEDLRTSTSALNLRLSSSSIFTNAGATSVLECVF